MSKSKNRHPIDRPENLADESDVLPMLLQFTDGDRTKESNRAHRPDLGELLVPDVGGNIVLTPRQLLGLMNTWRQNFKQM